MFFGNSENNKLFLFKINIIKTRQWPTGIYSLLKKILYADISKSFIIIIIIAT